MTTPLVRLGGVETRQVDGVVRLVQGVFGDAALGAYLFGSAVRGGLRPDSDLDILVVTCRRTRGSERRAVIEGLLWLSRSPERSELRHLEVTVVVERYIRPWRYPPPMEVQYGDWWRREFESGDLAPWTSPNADLAVILTSARADGVSLFGPPAVALLDPIPRPDLERAMRDEIPELLPGLEEGDTRNSLLTLARIWYTLETGTIESKDVAAGWALKRLPAGAGEALALARAAYRGDAVDAWDAAAKATARFDWDAMLEGIGDQGSDRERSRT